MIVSVKYHLTYSEGSFEEGVKEGAIFRGMGLAKRTSRRWQIT